MLDSSRSHREREECARFNAAVRDEIVGIFRRGELAGVVLGAGWDRYLGQRELSGKHTPRMVAARGQPASIDAVSAALTHGLTATVEALTGMGIKVIVIAPAPEQQFDAPRCLARKTVAFCCVSREQAERRRRVALKSVTTAVDSAPGVRLWDPEPALCSDGRCLVERDDVALYVDNHHLSAGGARWLATNFDESAAWLAGAQSEASILKR